LNTFLIQSSVGLEKWYTENTTGAGRKEMEKRDRE
jgi:hypothetical protein